MGDAKRIRDMDRRNTCLHESAHSVVRQVKLGNLDEVRVERRGTSYAYPKNRTPFKELDRDELAKVAVVVAAGFVAEAELCSRVGDQERAVADDMKQWEGIQHLCGFSDEEMDAFHEEARELLGAHEAAVRKVALELDRKRKLTGEQVSRLIESVEGELWHALEPRQREG